jgi:Ca-activated chloride channel family protein
MMATNQISKPCVVKAVAVMFAVAFLAAMGPGLVHAQGFLIATNNDRPTPLPRPIIRPRPTPAPMSYKIKELAINARIIDQVAQVQVAQSFVNTGSRPMETRFVFPIPYDGAIDSLTLLVDGKEYPAQMLTKERAREIYEGFMRRNQDPALLEWIGTGMFQTSVFPVPPGAERKVTITYKQLLRKDHSLTDFLFPMSAAKYTSAPVEKLTLSATIESATAIKSVYSPTHSIDIKRPDEHRAQVSYSVSNVVPASDFRLFYDVKNGKVGAAVISYRPTGDEDGYFLLLASPEVNWMASERTKKNVICVFDRSGSMSGKKIEQAREALKFVLNNLNDGDLFNIVAYDSEVESFKPELQAFNEKTRKEAMGFVSGIFAGGGTNIDGGLATAFAMLPEGKRPNYILFMTDGQPTIGETNEGKIVAAAKSNNKVRARVINFGVGFDVNSRLLDRLAREGFGTSEYVRPNEDIEDHVARLYNKISSPVMTEVAVNFEFDAVKVEDGNPITRVYPKQVNDLFEGQQLVMVGRYKKAGPAKVTVSGTIGDKQQKFDFPANLVASSGDGKYGFVEKLWAMRRVGEIIDELDLHGKNDELIKELVALATKHGIITPYTSFLADDSGSVRELAEARRGAGRGNIRTAAALDQLKVAEGRLGFVQRDQKKHFQEAQQVVADAAVAGGGAIALSVGEKETYYATAVRNVGNECLYRRSGLWLHTNCADLDPVKDKDKIKTVKRFSEDYFKLVRANSKQENDVLARQRAGEQLLIRLRGEAVQIVD